MNAVYEQFPPDELMKHLFLRKERLERLLVIKEKAKLKEPEGTLRVIRNKGTVQYYQATNLTEENENSGKINPKVRYIPKKHDSLIKALAQKEYNSKIIAETKHELQQLNKYIESISKSNFQIVSKSFSMEKQKLIEPVTLNDEEYVSRWLMEEYIKKGFAEDVPEIFTSTGLRVRSKSELIIAETLSRMEIPFRYEYPLKLKEFNVHPDFFCLNVRTRKEFAWEHFGMLDDSEYAKCAVKKIRNYEQNGYSLGKKLIVTMETQNNPINSRHIERIIKQHLL